METFKDRTGNKPDVTTGEGFDGFSVSRYMLFRDPAFEGILMAEKVLALVDFLIGDDCILSTLTGHMRGQGGGETLPTGYLPLHGDDTSPQPQAGISNLATLISFDRRHRRVWLSRICSGSHKKLRLPTPQESILAGNANPERTVGGPCRFCSNLAFSYVAWLMGVKNARSTRHIGRIVLPPSLADL